MKILRPVLIFGALLILILAIVFWWNQPTQVDMADYAPADSLVYLELNSITELAKAIEQNEVWKTLTPFLGVDTKLVNTWGASLARAGLAPVKTVVLTRAQLALVMVGLNSTEEAGTLRVRPEVALVVETHTSNWRIRGGAVEALKHLADYAYGQSNCVSRSADYVECSSTVNERKLIGAIDGSVVIIGNTPAAVQTCLEVRRGLRPSLKSDPELQKLRQNLDSQSALSFGYISQGNVAKIFSWAAPLLMGRAPGDRPFEELLSNSASKVLGSVAWTSRSNSAWFEDRYVFALTPAVRTRLEPAFETAEIPEELWRFVPQFVQSLTIYDQKDPTRAWSALNSAVAFNLDAVSAVMFASLLRNSLAVYGIQNPSEVLQLLSPPLTTMRARADEQNSVLIARVVDETKLREIFRNQPDPSVQILEGRNGEPKLDHEFTAVFLNKENTSGSPEVQPFAESYVVMGKTSSVKACLEELQRIKYRTTKATNFEEARSDRNVAITTFANDDVRISSFFSAIASLRGSPFSSQQSDKLKEAADGFFSITETTLTPLGIERKTRSRFGQFSTLLSFVQADRSSAAKPN